jgi:hypothetical protein
MTMLMSEREKAGWPKPTIDEQEDDERRLTYEYMRGQIDLDIYNRKRGEKAKRLNLVKFAREWPIRS